MKPLSPTELQDLAAKADAATPGPWRLEQYDGKSLFPYWMVTKHIEGYVSPDIVADHLWEPGDGAFIAAANPDTIKRLLTMVSEAREVLEDMLDTAKVRDMSSIANPPVFRARDLLARWNGGGQ